MKTPQTSATTGTSTVKTPNKLIINNLIGGGVFKHLA